MRLGLALSAALLLSACAGGIVPPSSEAPPPTRHSNTHVQLEPPAERPSPAIPLPAKPVATVIKGPNARSAGAIAGPDLGNLPLSDDNARRALSAFRTSCPALLRRTDQTGLTQPTDWAAACATAMATPDAAARQFFVANFETLQIGAGSAFATGYFIPEIAASRTPSARYATPIYRKPLDLAEVDLGLFSDSLKGKRIRGHVVGDNFVPFADRAAIVGGALSGQGLEIAYAEDPIAFFFLQIQGSGILRMPDGSSQVIGYASQNGRDYTGIGSTMRSRNLFADGAYSMQNITNYLRTHPAEASALMNENKSFVFFRELPDRNIIGAMNVPLTDRTSVAADPAFVPLGSPIFLSMDNATANGLWIAQDTGGAIKGANRVDTYWGAGAQAQGIAGGMSARGTAFILVPIGTLARLTASAPTSPKP